jgi:hypothetical protein
MGERETTMSATTFEFTQPSTSDLWLCCSMQGPSGSGKTVTSLRIATGIVSREGGEIGVIDTEEGRAKLELRRFRFRHLDLRSRADQRPAGYVKAIKAAAAAKIRVLIVDSLSHEWEALLRMKDDLPYKEQFTGWAKLNPEHDAVIRAIREYPGHVIVTLRANMAYKIDEQVRDGRTVNVPVKVGMEPVMRARSEYEFDLAFELDGKSCVSLAKRPRGLFQFLDGYSQIEPGEELGQQISDALRGAPVESTNPLATKVTAPPKEDLRAKYDAMKALFGGEDRLLKAIGEPRPRTLREAIERATHAHEMMLEAEDDPPFPDDPDDDIPLDDDIDLPVTLNPPPLRMVEGPPTEARGQAEAASPQAETLPGSAPPNPDDGRGPSTDRSAHPGPAAKQSRGDAEGRPEDGASSATPQGDPPARPAKRELFIASREAGVSLPSACEDLYPGRALAQLSDAETVRLLRSLLARAKERA